MAADGGEARFRHGCVVAVGAVVLGLCLAGVAWGAWRGVAAERQSRSSAVELRRAYDGGLADGTVSFERFRAMRIDQNLGELADDSWLPRPEGLHLEGYGMSDDDQRAELRYRGSSRAIGYCFDVTFGTQEVASVSVVENC